MWAPKIPYLSISLWYSYKEKHKSVQFTIPSFKYIKLQNIAWAIAKKLCAIKYWQESFAVYRNFTAIFSESVHERQRRKIFTIHVSFSGFCMFLLTFNVAIKSPQIPHRSFSFIFILFFLFLRVPRKGSAKMMNNIRRCHRPIRKLRTFWSKERSILDSILDSILENFGESARKYPLLTHRVDMRLHSDRKSN